MFSVPLEKRISLHESLGQGSRFRAGVDEPENWPEMPRVFFGVPHSTRKVWHPRVFLDWIFVADCADAIRGVTFVTPCNTHLAQKRDVQDVGS